MSSQEQFLDVVDRDVAEIRFRAALRLTPLGVEQVELPNALGRVLAEDALAGVDVPAFDRSNFDGYAIQAADSFGACESEPRQLELLPVAIEAGVEPQILLGPGQAAPISTGGMMPRGADAVLMIEHSDEQSSMLLLYRAVTPGTGVTFAGTDIALGETVLRTGTFLTSRETGVLAAIGKKSVNVWRRPRVAIISTGNEIIAPGEAVRPASVFDSNSQVVADAVRELGGIPEFLGIVRDDADQLRSILRHALASSDCVLLSGGTSKGQGDLSYRIVAELENPGVVVHGVALKPGKPICLAVTDGKPVVVLPGFPTSAIFTFHEFVAPILRIMGGLPMEQQQMVSASLATKVMSEIGRTEYLLVGLVESETGLTAFPMGKGSGSVTTFSQADGFVTIARHTEIVGAGTPVQVRLIGRGWRVADLVVIGSHCVGLDFLLSRLQQQGFSTKLINVGSSAGLSAIKRNECDLAGIHLLDHESGLYNRPFLDSSIELITGYRRMQGLVFRRDDIRLLNKNSQQLIEAILNDPTIVMINRNQGSGTRIVIDQMLAGTKPAGYANQANNHRAVVAAITQGRADWGVAIEAATFASGLAFVPVREECFDFALAKARRQRPSVQAFVKLLSDPQVRQALSHCGFDMTLANG